MDSQGPTRSPEEYETPRDCMELVMQNLESSFQSVEQQDNTPGAAATDPSTPKSCASSSPIPSPLSTVTQEQDSQDDIAQILMKKLSGLRVPEVRKLREIAVPFAAADHDMSGCSECEESDQESDDDDLCSTTSSDPDNDQVEGNLSQDPFIQPPMLPDVHFHVPLETEDDIARVRRALMIKGVLEVSCDLERQTVTVSGNVSPRRLLKKVKQVKRNSRILSNNSSSSSALGFLTSAAHAHGSNTRSGVNHHDASHHASYAMNPPPHNLHPLNNNGYSFEYPSNSQESVLVAPRPRPTYQSYTFRNRPSSPYLRTYSPSDMSPPSSPDGPAAYHHELDAWDSAIRYYNSTRSYAPAFAAGSHSMSSSFGRIIFDDYYYQ
ncbi:unnamed protein product [Sphagnum troendelagicum]|uniref:HMA domain-containing protein n=1 Tax=Sphagnum troendelagicum TaxID=128251 RepID=A0ABP0U1D1_9BRYO